MPAGKTWKAALIGECMVELQDAAPPAAGSLLSLKFGGDTFNTAVYLARLGARLGNSAADRPAVAVEYVSALGDDALSGRMLDFWQSEGLGCSLVQRLPGRLPGVYYISLRPDGERVFSYWRGEAAARDCFDTPAAERLLEELGRFDCIYLSGISLAVLRESGRQRLLERLEQLSDRRGGNCRVVFDGNYRPRLWGGDAAGALERARPVYARLLQSCGTLLLTWDELPAFGLEPAVNETRLEKLGPAEIVVKDGGREALVWSGGRLESVAPVQAAAVLDTTAAGDSFAAAYVLGRELGYGAAEAARRAHKLAGAVIAHYGAIIPGEVMPDIF
jgi:2-dehydro-3-deoxygluconokinase